jgi:hypothetical protein
MMPDLVPVALFDKLDEFMLEFEEHDMEVFSGVMVVGEAAAYAEVWEWGNLRQTKPGPRTVMGTNPKGEQVWLSSQAPFGWIRVNEDEMWSALQHELSKMSFDQPNARAMTVELEKRAYNAAKLVAQILQEHAPKDRGVLAAEVVAVKPSDGILDTEDGFGALALTGDEE